MEPEPLTLRCPQLLTQACFLNVNCADECSQTSSWRFPWSDAWRSSHSAVTLETRMLVLSAEAQRRDEQRANPRGE